MHFASHARIALQLLLLTVLVTNHQYDGVNSN